MSVRCWNRAGWPVLMLLCWLGSHLSAHAEGLLDQVSQQLARHSVVHADFVQTRQMAALKKPLQLSGQLVVSRAHGVIWRIDKPYRLTYVLLPKGVQEILPDGRRRERTAQDIPGVGSIESLFKGLLLADPLVLQQHFDVVAEGAPTAWVLRLTPKKGPLQRGLQAANMSGGEQVAQVVLQERSGDSTTIQFLHTEVRDPLTAEEARLLGVDG